MPSIETNELIRLRALLIDVSRAAREIWDKAPNVGPLAVNIQRLSQSAFAMLDDVQGRNDPSSVPIEENRRAS